MDTMLIKYPDSLEQHQTQVMLDKVMDSDYTHKSDIENILLSLTALIFSGDFKPSPSVFDSVIMESLGKQIVLYKNPKSVFDTYYIMSDLPLIESRLMDKLISPRRKGYL